MDGLSLLRLYEQSAVDRARKCGLWAIVQQYWDKGFVERSLKFNIGCQSLKMGYGTHLSQSGSMDR